MGNLRGLILIATDDVVVDNDNEYVETGNGLMRWVGKRTKGSRVLLAQKPVKQPGQSDREFHKAIKEWQKGLK